MAVKCNKVMGDLMSLTEEKIKILIDNIRAEIEAGWSIVLARKKVLKSDQNSICKTVMASKQYQDLLNEYLSRKKLNYHYEVMNGKLNCKTGRRKRGRNVSNAKP